MALNDPGTPEVRQACRPGPWGDLQTTRITTEAPADLAAAFLKFDAGVWHLRVTSVEDFSDLLREKNVPEAIRKQLLDSTRVDITGGIIVRPDDATLLNLPAEARAELYNVLSNDGRNYVHSDPFRYEAKRAGEWLSGSGLPDNALTMISQLMYHRGNTAMFADIAPVFRVLPSDKERIKLLQTLTRKPALLVKLKINETTDSKALEEYWGNGPNRRKDLSTLIDSLKKVPGGHTLDVAHLLPRFPRRVLYTYPEVPAEGPEAAPRYDCHWTSLNFWNDRPDDRFMDPKHVFKVLQTEYDVLKDKNYRLGDVLVLMKSQTLGIHSCVYVADDIVFTKNGASLASPWTLERLSDVVAYYEIQGPVEVMAYRRK